MNKKVLIGFKSLTIAILFLSFVIYGCESNDNPVNQGTNNLKASNKVLVEFFTNTSCINCPPPGSYLDLVDSLKGVTINDTNVIIIRVHTSLYANDPFYDFNVPDNKARQDYYQAGLYNPICFLNGSNLPTYNSNKWTDSINVALAKKSTYAIADSNVYNSASRNGTLTLTIGQLSGVSVGDLKMHIAITEGHLYYTAPNGERWFENTLRKLVTPANGIDIQLSSGQLVNLIENYTLPEGIVEANSQIIIFLQSTSTAKIYAVDKKNILN
jgi:hypothetical protein